MPHGPEVSPVERFRRAGGWGRAARGAAPEQPPAPLPGFGMPPGLAAATPAPAAPPAAPVLAAVPGNGDGTGHPDGAGLPAGGNYPRPRLAPTGRPAPGAAPTPAVAPAAARLSPHVVAVPALASNVRPALVLREREARGLLAEARRHDVGVGGSFSAGPAGIQVWSGPFDGPGGSHGSAVHLGSVDWIYDTPVRYYATIYRAMVTAQGVAVNHTPHTILESVLRLTGLTVEGTRLTMPMPPPRDPFRRRA